VLAALLAVSGASVAAPLAPCPATPNCVSSVDPDPRHRVAPIGFTGSAQAARQTLLRILRETPRVRLVVSRPDYLKAEFSSAVFGFIDDVEFVIDAQAGVVHLRSASRTGDYDFGVNRRRIERLRAQFARLQDAAG